ncbi:MAG: thiamine pyrophosphate-dependent enzyme [Chloroflexota bacterium]
MTVALAPAGSNASIRRMVRAESFPTPFCPGCGHGILMTAILRAIDELGWSMDEMLFVSGIGCGGWIPSPHYAADTLHVTHGRPVAFSTGAKLYNPALKVVVIGGDGDIASIGGNHLIHAARRNLDMTVICANNGIYGMTGGQVTPTTPQGARTLTTPNGNPDRPFDLAALVAAAGASYVARYSVYHVRQLVRAIRTALEHPGFAFVECVSTCPTQYGRRNDLRSPADMLRYFRANSVPLGRAQHMSDAELAGKLIVGEFKR